MARSAHSIRALPESASDGSAISPGAPGGASASAGPSTGPSSRPPGRDVRGPAAVLPLAMSSVPVLVRLVGAVDRDTDVVGLVLGEPGQLDAQRVQVQPGHLLVQVL